MAKYIEVNIEGTILDLPEDPFGLKLTYVNSCSGGYGQILGDKSDSSFSFPATKQNNQVFEDWADPSRQNSNTAANRKDSFILVDGLPVLNGKAQLKKVVTGGGFYNWVGQKYSVAFFGNNASWFSLLKDKELGRDLDWTNENHDFTQALIVNGFNADPNLQGYNYSVIKFKDWANSDSLGSLVDLFETTPGLFLDAIVTNIFASIGYTVAGGWFSNPVNQRYFLLTPLPDKYPQEYSFDYLNVDANKLLGDTQSLPGLGIANFTAITFQDQTLFPLVGPNPYVPSVASLLGVGNTSTYTAPFQGFYQFEVSIKINNISGTGSFGFGVFVNGLVGPPTDPFDITTLDNNRVFNFSVLIQLETGDVCEFYCGGSPFLTFDIISGAVQITGEAQIVNGIGIDFTYLLRKWKITDFIKGITAAFNLCYQTDTYKKIVTILPKDDVTITSREAGTTVTFPGFHFTTFDDINNRVDLSKKGLGEPLNNIAQTQEYHWKSDGSDLTAQDLNDNQELNFGSCRYNMPPDRFKQKTEKNENPFFAGTVMFFDDSIRLNTSSLVPLIPLMWPSVFRDEPSADENQQQYEPRLLWHGGARGIDVDGNFRWINSTTGLKLNGNIPAVFFTSFNDTTGLDVNLSHSDVVIKGIEVKGMMRRFYLADLARMRVGKKYDAWLFWSALDILELSFMPKLLIDNQSYINEKIESFNPNETGSLKTTLLLDAPIENQDINSIENTLVRGLGSDYTNIDE